MHFCNGSSHFTGPLEESRGASLKFEKIGLLCDFKKILDMLDKNL